MLASPKNEMLIASVNSYEKAISDEKKRIEAEKLMNEAEQKIISEGAKNYKTYCAACHGMDGKGISLGKDELIAPMLANNKTVNDRNPQKLIKILLRGLTGPIDGKSYAANLMPSIAENDDAYIASVLSYIRNDFGNKARVIKEEDVARVRKATEDRTLPYTKEELDK
jgi:mono/diheme cytochrome c family protein